MTVGSLASEAEVQVVKVEQETNFRTDEPYENVTPCVLVLDANHQKQLKLV